MGCMIGDNILFYVDVYLNVEVYGIDLVWVILCYGYV